VLNGGQPLVRNSLVYARATEPDRGLLETLGKVEEPQPGVSALHR
jgi:hypothetical protein